MARLGFLVLGVIACVLSCTDAFSTQQTFDAFTFEGKTRSTTTNVVELRLAAPVDADTPAWKGHMALWKTQPDGTQVKAWEAVNFFLRFEMSPSNSYCLIGVYYLRDGDLGGGWLKYDRFYNLPTAWNSIGYDYYWKFQVEDGGYRIHFNDIHVSETIPLYDELGPPLNGVPTTRCCRYPKNQYIDSPKISDAAQLISTSIRDSVTRDAAATFIRDFPCTNPCLSSQVRIFFKCDANDEGIEHTAADFGPECNTQWGEWYKVMLAPANEGNCDFLEYAIPDSGIPVPPNHPANTWYDDWCIFFSGVDCAEDQINGKTVYYDRACEAEPGFLKPSLRVAADATRRRSMGTTDSTPKRRARMRRAKVSGTKDGEVSGKLQDRHKARHESFLFNHRYLHPVCWKLEDIMYNNQNSVHFPALFYWCYDALWCYEEGETCGTDKKQPRHVYEARMNACLGVRGTVWTDLQIKEVLLNNFTNSSFDLNITNGTIYAVAPIPPSELVDDGPSFLTRLPMYASLFGNPNCNTENDTYAGCAFPEGLPSFMSYRYKNFEYLRDWIDGVNYNSWLQERRRLYGIPITQFDYKRYCDINGYLCDPHAECQSRRKWPGYRCRCREADGYFGDGYFCTKAETFAYTTFSISATVSINATLDKIAERFENLTGIPREALDISSSVDISALEDALVAGGEVSLTMKYPTGEGVARQFELEGYQKVDNEAEKIAGIKATLAKRTARPGDKPVDANLIAVEDWLSYTDIQVWRTAVKPFEYQVQYPGPSLVKMTENTAFTLTVLDGDKEEDVMVGVADNIAGAVDNLQALRMQKVGQEASATAGVFVQPEPQAAADEPHPASHDVAEPVAEATQPANVGGPDVATPMLVAGGSVAGVLLLAIVGWTMHKRSSPAEKEATVLAVHDLAALQHTTVEVEASSLPSEDAAEGSSEATHPWRSAKAGADDSFTLAQDRSGIWK